MKNLLTINSSYTYQQILDRDLLHTLSIRHLDGYWDRVWSVHPIDDYFRTSEEKQLFGQPEIINISSKHIFIRGRFGFTKWLRKITPLNFLFGHIYLIFYLIRLVKKENISAIRTGDPLLCGLMGLIVSRFSGAKLMVRINANNDQIRKSTGLLIMPRFSRKEWVETRIETLVLTNASCIIAPSKNYIDFAVSKGASLDNCKLVRYGNLIDPRHLASAQGRPEITNEECPAALLKKPFLLSIARLEKLKFTDHCILTLHKLVQDGHDISLCMVGDGSLKFELEELAKKLGVSDRVFFLGNINQGYLSRIIPYSAAVLSPLTGRALTEAAFGEAAIVAYDLDWQSDLIIDGETGLLVPTEDWESMTEAVKKILASKTLKQKLGRGARARAFEILKPEEQTQLEIQAYKTMLGES